LVYLYLLTYIWTKWTYIWKNSSKSINK
jgi:hypothetical protein